MKKQDLIEYAPKRLKFLERNLENWIEERKTTTNWVYWDKCDNMVKAIQSEINVLKPILANSKTLAKF